MAAEMTDSGTAARNFVLAPNLAPDWRQTWRIYLSLCVVCFTIAGVCTWLGLWPILPIAGLELTALGVALYVSARRALDREVVRVSTAQVVVEKGRGRVERRWCFERAWTEVVLLPPRGRWDAPRLRLRSGGQWVELGGFLEAEELRSLARELARCIGPMASSGAGGSTTTGCMATMAMHGAKPTNSGR